MSDNQLKENQTTTATSEEDHSNSAQNQITPLRCFTGGLISGGLAVASYLLTKSVILTYADMPIKFNNPMAANIASTVRTLIMGITTLATFVFLMVTIGLWALGIKLIFEIKK
jgi:hypothetical protein